LTHAVELPGGFVVSDERSRLDLGFVHAALSGAPWMEERTRAQTERSWANCLPLGVYAPDGSPVGCGRLLTDRALRAHLGDVVIVPAFRGRGLGKALVEAALSHPELATVTHWTLATMDAHGLYARYGFVSRQQEGWMTLMRHGRPLPSGASGR
jgi:GNAT superfamily N-acetyltransferase